MNNEADVEVDVSELNDIVTETMATFAEAIVQAIQEILIDKGKYVSGDLANSLHFDIKQEDENIQMLIYAADYLKYIENGRLPKSRMPSIQEIIRWIQFKGIKPRTIKRKGINFKANAFPKGHVYKTTKLLNRPRFKTSKGKKTNLNAYKAQQRLGFIISHAIERDGIKPTKIVKPVLKIVIPQLQKELSQVFFRGYRNALGKSIKDAITTDSDRVRIEVNL